MTTSKLMLIVFVGEGGGHGFLLFKGPSSLDTINLEKKCIFIVHSWDSQNPHQHYLQKCKDRIVCIDPCQVTRRFSRMKMKGTQVLCNCKKKNSPFSGSNRRKKSYIQIQRENMSCPSQGSNEQ